MKLIELFPEIQEEKQFSEVFYSVEMMGIDISKGNNTAVVHIQADRVIPKDKIIKLENKLNEKLLGEKENRLSIRDSYCLSESYSIKQIFDLYHDSIELEISQMGKMHDISFRAAELEFTEDSLVIKLPDNYLQRKIGGAFREYFEKVYRERFQRQVTVKVEYVEASTDEDVKTAITNSTDVDETKGRQDNHYNTVDNQTKNSLQAQKAADIRDKAEKEAQNNEMMRKKASEKAPVKKNETYDKFKFRKKKLPEDPDIFYGKPFEGSCINISDIQDEVGDVVIRGKVLSVEKRELKIEKTLMTFAITDFTDTIKAKLFLKEEQLEEVEPELKENSFIQLKGVAQMDTFDNEIGISSVHGIKKIKDFTEKRMDQAPEKRVELHAHTKMSDMDAVVPPRDLIRTAFFWGQKAVAITDHGVVQGFTEANHALDKKEFKDNPDMLQRLNDFKIIYGVEAYLVDDVQEIVFSAEGKTMQSPFAAISITTSGSGLETDKIIGLSAAKMNGDTVEIFHSIVKQDLHVSPEVTKQSGITDSMLLDAPKFEKIFPEFLEFIQDCVLLSYHAQEQISFCKVAASFIGIGFQPAYIDVEALSRMLYPEFQSYRLGPVVKELKIKSEVKGSRAEAEATLKIFQCEKLLLEQRGINELEGMNSLGRMSEKSICSLPMYHAIILCQNETGRINLYRLISFSHINYYNKRPRIPKSLFQQYREGLLIGSACEAGELYRALVFQRPEAEIHRLAKFYDYYEIQPLGNNEFMIHDNDYYVSSFEDLKVLNRKIVELGETYHKLVVATCDVHFLNPEDEIYRRIIMAGQGFKDADRQAPLYLRTTEEMLEEFTYLGQEKAYEVVVTNTNKIADLIEKISPVRPDKCPPVIENSDVDLRNICYEKAYSMYGNPLPEIVSERLEHELGSIIKNGFAVMYIIAQKLVWKSNEDGYLVGSRGSVGSSFVATMAGITEVNPLPPHYYCPKCHYSDFTSEAILSNGGNSGFDLPDADCPVCRSRLNKDGNNIPFETFLGFNGDKEPDIDLNFSGEYQSKAHEYTEVIFGEGHTFRAGTITGLADKTAYGYVMKYFEERGIPKRRAEIERIAKGCEGVRKSTGQHPGGIIVLPHGEEIYSFTPVQRPANDVNSTTITTHFDYHSIDHNLLKLDILGHDDPTMVRMLTDLTGVKIDDIPMDDRKVLSLFESTEALGIRPEDIDGCPLGSLGLPELGTDFVIQMLVDTKPKSFSDMIRISGLSHGTDVWTNNTQTLIAENKCTLSSAVCTRDDIMTYLISKNIESGVAFKIMESVRKGKGLSPEWEALMLEHEVPEWYIWSCKRIQYMFPKAHACAYVMMAFRIAYFKIYHPLEYYAAYFSIRATAMDYRLMCRGKDLMLQEMQKLKQRAASKNPETRLSKKEEDILKDMKNVLEMYSRGFDFLPIDIFKAKATRFQVIDGKIMPALNCIDGLGEKAAEQIVEAVKDGSFLSRDDFRTRCKVSKTVIDTMNEMGLFGALPESNQISLLDFI